MTNQNFTDLGTELRPRLFGFVGGAYDGHAYRRLLLVPADGQIDAASREAAKVGQKVLPGVRLSDISVPFGPSKIKAFSILDNHEILHQLLTQGDRTLPPCLVGEGLARKVLGVGTAHRLLSCLLVEVLRCSYWHAE